MADKEMYDYLSETPVTPTCNETLNVAPQRVLVEYAEKIQEMNKGDDGSIEVISHSDTPIFEVILQWDAIGESDAGTILDMWADPNKANGIFNSFKWVHRGEDSQARHTYTVCFAEPKLARSIYQAGKHLGITNVRLLVLGRAPE